MTNIGGPKKPNDPPKGVGGKVLSFPKVEKRGQVGNVPDIKAESPPDKALTVQTPVTPTAEGFDPNAAKGTARPETVPIELRGGNVKARLAALGQLPIKTAAKDGGRIKETPVGKIFDGSLTIESASGLRKLEGVVRVAGDLVIAESVAKSADFLVLKSLVEIGGRLTIEGNASVGVLDALENLERARGIYVGFNAALTRISLPKLRELEAAFIVEHNQNLVDISLPAFAKGGRYLHIHENAALVSVSLPSLASLEDELSILDNPRLNAVKVGSKEKPAKVPHVEARGNGAPSFGTLFARA
jgi:hypothetical protein